MIHAQKRAEEEKRFDDWYAWITKDTGNLMYAGTMLAHANRYYADRIALLYGEISITYKELFIQASGIMRMLKDRGIQPKDRVVICFENSPDFYRAYFGVWQTGAVVVPLNIFLSSDELNHVIHDAQPKLIITTTDRSALFTKVNIPIITEKELTQSYQHAEPAQMTELLSLEEHEMAALLYTSGTTGLPKGVMLSSRNIMINLVQGLSRLGLVRESPERIFAVLPLFHVIAQNACVWGSMFTGITVILVPKIERRAILEGLQHKPTIFLGVPALYGLLCLLKTAPLDEVKYFVSGGDALSDRIRIAFSLLYRRKLCNGYGLTETAPLIAAEFDDVLMPASIVGTPCIGVQVAIRDEQGREVPHGSIGQLWVKGENVMLGYYHEPEMTARVLQDGWLNTGDLAYITRNGAIAIAGREKDLIIHKGFNIYPQEVENVISSHQNVLYVGVVGKKDPLYGEIPIAYVQLRHEDVHIHKVLDQLCKQHLAAYKVPRSFICSTKALPTTATGKVDKKVLRAWLAKENEQEEADSTYYFKS